MVELHNSGWGIEGFRYRVLNDIGIEITSGILSLDPETNDFQINLLDLNMIDNTYYTLSISPINNELNSNELIIYFQDYILGDINNDLEVNIFDIIDLNNLILTDSEFFAWYDLNHDLNLDILDIIILLNIILIDNN